MQRPLVGITGAACVLMLLVGCGAAQTATTSMPGETSAGPTSLQITLPKSTFPTPLFPQPIDKTVTDTRTVQHLYAVTLALPPVQKGAVYHCPSEDPNLIYTLVFQEGTTVIQTAHLQATGCQFLNLSPTDVRVTDSAFLTLFTQTLNE